MELVNSIAIFAVIFNLDGNKANAINKVPSIIDGKPVDISIVPFQVTLEINYFFECGGALISNIHILTAAHCLQYVTNRDSVYANQLRVRASTSTGDVAGQILYVHMVRLHSRFDPNTLRNDIGLVKLTFPVQISDTLSPIALTADWPQIGDTCIVSGYGSQKGSKQQYPVDTLKTAKLEVYGQSECEQYMQMKVSTEVVCAGNRTGIDGPCNGDSGGPLTINGKLAGVVSAGFGCGTYGAPAVFTSVRHYLSWIMPCMQKMNLGPYSC